MKFCCRGARCALCWPRCGLSPWLALLAACGSDEGRESASSGSSRGASTPAARKARIRMRRSRRA